MKPYGDIYLGSDKGLLPDDTKPLPELILLNIIYENCCHLAESNFTETVVEITRGVTIHWCIAMHRYFVTTIRIDTANPVYRDSQETIYTGILERD